MKTGIFRPTRRSYIYLKRHVTPLKRGSRLTPRGKEELSENDCSGKNFFMKDELNATAKREKEVIEFSKKYSYFGEFIFSFL